MLAEDRMNEIVKLVQRNQSVTVVELTELLNASESTIRRDLLQLHKDGRLIKVHGGATAMEMNYQGKDNDFSIRNDLNREEKLKVAAFAAEMIDPDDFVYIDGGTTTGLLIDCITEKNATYITNAPDHAKWLVKKGCHNTYVLGGRLKDTTQVVIGAETVEALLKYNFTKGFFGTNGVHFESGFTTPEIEESLVKKTAFGQTRDRYILCDHTKFDQIAPVTFAKFEDAVIITDKILEAYTTYENIMEVE